MAKIILIETSPPLCSVAISIDGEVVAYRESSEQKAHASLTAVFVQECLQQAGLSLRDCDAVAVSKGPGSYTGLRVGVSTAKGLCFGAALPLITIGTLDILVAQNLEKEMKFVVPMIDARRMEVYAAVFSPDGTQLTETEPVIVDENSFVAYTSLGPTLFIGDGADKCKPVLSSPNSHFIQCYPSARSLAPLAEAAFSHKDFADLAYFEPFYLKQFVATTSTKKLF